MDLKDETAEQALIGAVMVKPQLWARYADRIRPEHFADALHARVWQRIGERMVNDAPVSPITIGADLAAETQNLDGGLPLYLVRCASSVLSFDLRGYIEVVRDLATKRQMFNLMLDIREALETSSDDGIHIAESTHTLLAEILEHEHTGKYLTESMLRQQTLDNLERPRETFRTGYAGIDKCMVGGLHAGRAYAIAARRKVGKTLMLGSISYNLARNGVKHLFICSEASGLDIIQRNWAREIGTNDQRFKDPDLVTNTQLVDRMVGSMPNASNNAHYLDLYDPRFTDLQTAILTGIVTKKPRVVIFDYLQLVGGREKGMGQVEHLDRVSQWFANMARKHNVAVLCAAQINQEGNVRFGEGMTLAFDQVYRLEREKGQDEGSYGTNAWMDLMVSRYTAGHHGVGSKHAPGLELEIKTGPWFKEVEYE